NLFNLMEAKQKKTCLCLSNICYNLVQSLYIIYGNRINAQPFIYKKTFFISIFFFLFLYFAFIFFQTTAHHNGNITINWSKKANKLLIHYCLLTSALLIAHYYSIISFIKISIFCYLKGRREKPITVAGTVAGH
ncbi:hypothetical protein ACJX0J_027460, partial [Zea mays]